MGDELKLWICALQTLASQPQARQSWGLLGEIAYYFGGDPNALASRHADLR